MVWTRSEFYFAAWRSAFLAAMSAFAKDSREPQRSYYLVRFNVDAEPLHAAPHRSESVDRLEVVLVDRLEGMPEVEVRDLAAQDDPGDGREAVVQPCPESSVDDLAAEVARPVEVPYRV